MTLPELTGSPKQIAWAEKIRAGAIEAIRREATEEPEATIEAVVALAAIPQSAGWWIEHRVWFEYGPGYQLKTLLKGAGYTDKIGGPLTEAGKAWAAAHNIGA